MRQAKFAYDRKSNADKRRASREANALAKDLSRTTGLPFEVKWSNGAYFVFTKDEAKLEQK